MLFSLFKHYLELYITGTALKVSQSLYCFTTSISYGVENYFPILWGTGISDAVLSPLLLLMGFEPFGVVRLPAFLLNTRWEINAVAVVLLDS